MLVTPNLSWAYNCKQVFHFCRQNLRVGALNRENLHSGILLLAEINAHCLIKKVSQFIFPPFIPVVQLDEREGRKLRLLYCFLIAVRPEM